MEVEFNDQVFKHMTSFGFEIKIIDLLILILAFSSFLLVFFLTVGKVLMNKILHKRPDKVTVKPIQEIRKKKKLFKILANFIPKMYQTKNSDDSPRNRRGNLKKKIFFFETFFLKKIIFIEGERMSVMDNFYECCQCGFNVNIPNPSQFRPQNLNKEMERRKKKSRR